MPLHSATIPTPFSLFFKSIFQQPKICRTGWTHGIWSSGQTNTQTNSAKTKQKQQQQQEQQLIDKLTKPDILMELYLAFHILPNHFVKGEFFFFLRNILTPKAINLELKIQVLRIII